MKASEVTEPSLWLLITYLVSSLIKASLSFGPHLENNCEEINTLSFDNQIETLAAAISIDFQWPRSQQGFVWAGDSISII